METHYSFNSSDSSNHRPASFHRALHAVRKPAPHPNKKPTAPLPPNPTRVYKVDRMNFRELVQMLTGAASTEADPALSQPRRLREVAPLPLELTAASQPQALPVLPEKTASSPLSELYRDLMLEAQSDVKTSHEKTSDGFSLGLGLSPRPIGWSSVPLLSPGAFTSCLL